MKRSRVIYCLFSWLFLGALATAQDAPEYPKPDFSSATLLEVSRIIDGDTVALKIGSVETTVRLVGVDTPETKHPSKPVQAFGKEATKFLENLLTDEKVWLVKDSLSDHRDKYNRTLGHLFRYPDGLFVNLEIIRQGYGRAYINFPFEHEALFKHYDKKAQAANKGLWMPVAPSALITPNAPAYATPVKTPAQGVGASVYKTKTGSKYHRGTCSYLKSSKTPISVQQAKSEGLGPCSVCRPHGSAYVPAPKKAPGSYKAPAPSGGVTVYKTKTGKKYHSGNCRYLSKSKIPISLQSAKSQGLGACSVCSPPR